MIVLGAGMLMTIGDATGEACDYPGIDVVKAGEIFDNGDQEGTYVVDGMITGTISVSSVSSVITVPSITGTVAGS